MRWARHSDELSPQSARLVADGGEDFRRAVYRAAESDAIDSYQQLDDAMSHINSLSGPAKVQARGFVAESGDDGLRTVLRFADDPDADLGPFVRKIENFDPDGKREIARMAADADDGVRLADQLGYGQLQRIADQDAGVATARLNNRGVGVSNIERLVNEGVDLKRVDTLMRNQYRGWSSKGSGLTGHYQDHVVRDGNWGGSISKRQYDQKAQNLLTNKDAEIYYQTDNRNLAVYDPSDNAFAAGNINGRVQTLFQPDQGRQYVLNRIQSANMIRLK